MDKQSISTATKDDDAERIFKIELTNKNISSISSLKQYEKLRCLILSYNVIEKIENLQALPDLRQLHLQNNAIIKISNLQNNKNLQTLNLANNRIEKIENIGHLIKLESLLLDNNYIPKLSGLQYLKQLKVLSVRNNNLQSIQNLPAFSKLSVLLLNNNKIKSISNNLFASSKALSNLDLSNNKIQNTAFLQMLSGLETLNLSKNHIKELNISVMPNLQSLNVSDNQIQKLPSVGTCFPQLVTLNVSHNFICSQMQILSSISQANYLTEFDFRENPMFSQSFQSALQKIHSFDFLNGNVMTKAGAKYYEQVEKIQADLLKNTMFYGEDDEKDRQIKMSGFFNDQLEQKMSGMKVNRPNSPAKRKKNTENPIIYDRIETEYNQFVKGDHRIKVIRQVYLKICGNYNIINSEHILTELPPQTAEYQSRANLEDSCKNQKEEDKKFTNLNQLQNNQAEIKKENQKNLSKWKELKNREKTFKIRDVINKSRGRQSSAQRVPASTLSTNWANQVANTGLKHDKIRSQLLKTQVVPRKMGDELLKTMVRPSSMRKKQ